MPPIDTLDPAIAAVIDDALSQAPAPPRDVDLFSSNTLFGQPGIYPDGSPMEPAAGEAPDEETARAQLERVLNERAHLGVDAARALARFDRDHGWHALAPDPLVRAALACGAGTIAETVLLGFPAHTPVQGLRIGPLASPGRVVGPPAAHPVTTHRAVNDRYRAEHPALVTPSLAHDLLWTPEASDHTTEALLHAVVALVHIQAIAASPRLAHLGTELARRQNSLAITLLNSRLPGSPVISLIAPDGPGTIPGGADGMQSPDWWSIPFGPEDADHAVTALSQLYGNDPVDPRHPERSAIPAFARLFDRGSFLEPVDRLRANVALGLIDPTPLVASHPDLGPVLAAAMAVWS